MKKIYVFVFSMVFSMIMYGQLINPQTPDINYEFNLRKELMPDAFSKIDNDTIGWNTGIPKFLSPNVNLYTIDMTSGGVNVGYWFGTNYTPSSNISISYWAQCYLNDAPIKIVGVIAMVAGLKNNSNSNNSRLLASIYPLAQDYTVVGGTQSNPVYGPGPKVFQGVSLASAAKSIHEFDTTWLPNMAFNYFHFENPAQVNADFGIVLNFQPLVNHSDVLYLYCDEPGNGLGLHFTMYAVNPNQTRWLSTQFAGGQQMNVNMSVFAVVDNSSANIHDVFFFNGIKMSVFPNPANQNATIGFELQRDSDVKIQLIDINGAVIQTHELGFKASGSHEFNIDVSTISSGNYLLSMIANNNRLTKYILIE